MKGLKLRIIGIVFIVFGAAVALSAYIMDCMAEKKGEELVDTYMEYVQTVSQTEYRAQDTDTAVTPQAAEAVVIPEGVMGVIIIDKISLKAPLTEGTDNKSIRYALGHFKDTALPGEAGNFAVAGHRSYTFGEYFNRLDEVEIGDTVRVVYGTGDYTYIVDESYVVEPSHTEVLDPTEEPVITLVTCTPKWTGTHRLIVRGHLAEAENE